MGKTRGRSISTPWFRALGALGIVASASVASVAYRDDVAAWIKPWIIASAAPGLFTSVFWLVTGKTLRMKFGEIFGDRAPRRSSAYGALFTSKVEARWWLATMAIIPLALLSAVAITASGVSQAWLLVPWGIAVVMDGFYRWWYWPAWRADESAGPVTRLLWRPGWQTAGAWSAERWREAFELADLPVSQVPKARFIFFTLLAGGTVAMFAATEATNPEDYASANALVRDLETKGLFWACEHVDVDGYGYERAPHESDAALCSRAGGRILVHVYAAESETEGPYLAPEEEPIFRAWVRGPRWIVETTDRATAEEVEEAIGGRVTTDRPS